MMTRVEITLGLLSLLGVIAVTAAVGIGEFGDEGRMARAARGYDQRSVEAGAQMFDQYCSECHAFNGGGLKGPPLDETSGLHAGSLGEGIAWRLEEMNWDRSDPYGFVYSTIAAGRMVSTRPERWVGNGNANEMAMPAWSQHYAGPLREDQIKDLANYIVDFRSYFPPSNDPEAGVKACRMVLETMDTYNPNYTSHCYEKVCQADIAASGKEAPVAPKAPDFEGADGVVDQAKLDKAIEDYFAGLWRGCKAVGGKLPPESKPTATAEATEAAEGEDGEAVEGDEAAGDEATADGTPAADDEADDEDGTPGPEGTADATAATTPAATVSSARPTPTP
jgi:mono/diheme cytochrome c family protein